MMGVARGWRKLATAVAIPLLLTACGGSGMNDLEQFVAEVKARKPAPIKPLPEDRDLYLCPGRSSRSIPAGSFVGDGRR